MADGEGEGMEGSKFDDFKEGASSAFSQGKEFAGEVKEMIDSVGLGGEVDNLLGKATDYIKDKSPLPPEVTGKMMEGLSTLTSKGLDLDEKEEVVEVETTTVKKEEGGKGGIIQVIIQVAVVLLIIPLLGMNGKILHQTRNGMATNDTANDTNDALLNDITRNVQQILSSNSSTNNASGLEGIEQSSSLLKASVAKILTNARNASKKTGSIRDIVEDQSVQSVSNTMSLNQVIDSVMEVTGTVANIVSRLNQLEDDSSSRSESTDQLNDAVNELLDRQNPLVFLSCSGVYDMGSMSPSGYYQFKNYTAYCNMGTLCGSGGGWTRLAYLDMSDDTQNCPSGFREYQENNVTACGRPVTNSGSCASVQFPSNGISYSQICGRVTGYQYGSPDAVRPGNTNIDSPYVDGISITCGSPRKHVWTLMAGSSDSDGVCPCSTSSNVQVQSFIGDDYFCESGNNASSASATLYTSDPLWDGQDCGGSEGPCCNATGIPWFHRDYGSTTTTDYIELRVCAGEETSDEDTPVSYYEIYVK
uniref:Fibrinogen C-terminal domain-containing protein n=1 Tax=Amphimedon queenslandica TaxID=400682 RepID=A0A1X7TCT7_AMPQE